MDRRITADRSRGGAYASRAVVGAALFSVFLFMTFYMQQTLGFSPLKAGLGFLPLTSAVVITAPLVQTKKILPRVRPRAVIVTGMILGTIARCSPSSCSRPSALSESGPA